MTPSLFQNYEEFGHVIRLHPVGRSVENNYTKSGNGLDARSANSHLGEITERWFKNKILRNYIMTVAKGADKRCAVSGRNAAS